VLLELWLLPVAGIDVLAHVSPSRF
jgi:hypothetical protein